MPQRAATIKSLPAAFEVVKAMQAQGLDWGEGYRPLGRLALAEIIETEMAAAVDRWLESLEAEDDGSRLEANHRPRALGRALRGVQRARVHHHPEGRVLDFVRRQRASEVTKVDFILFPSTPAFTLSSHPNIECEPRDPMDAPVRHGELIGDPDFESMGGSFRIEHVNRPLLLSLLPSVIHIPSLEGRTGKFNNIIELIMDECRSEKPGKKMILQRMLEVLLIEALRWQGIAHDEVRVGLLKGMQDPGLARVRAMHADVRANGRLQVLRKSPGFLGRLSPLVSVRSSAAVQSSISRAGGWRWQRMR